jgi:deoxyribodipyrimidine photolyase-related protein
MQPESRQGAADGQGLYGNPPKAGFRHLTGVPCVRNLIIVLGDQLDAESAALRGFDPAHDAVWMAEVAAESTYVLSHKVRIAYFLSAMRHFAASLRAREWRVEYRLLDDAANAGSLDRELMASIRKLKPKRLIMLEAGEYRVEQMLISVADEAGVPLEIRPDEHFYCGRSEFAAWADTHKQLRMEFFYRDMRKKSGVLMNPSTHTCVLTFTVARCAQPPRHPL